MSGWLRVERDGAVSVDEAGGAQLACHPGRFQLARSAPDLLIALRRPDGERRQVVGRVAFCGDLDGLPFSDLVMMLAHGRRSGLLHVLTGEVERTLVFSAGELVGATSTRGGERLGEVALRVGLLARTDLAQLLSSPAAGRRVGQRLVERGLLDRAGLARAVEAQIALVFEAILLRPVGSFLFRDHPAPPESGGPAVAAQALLLDGLRRLDEWAHYRTRVPSALAEVRRTGQEPVDPDALSLAILGALQEGPSNAVELAAALRRPELEVARALFHLVAAGAVEVRAEPSTRPLADLGVDPGPLRELLRCYDGAFAELFTEMALAGAGESFAAEARAVLEGEAIFAGLSFDVDGGLPMGEILERLPEQARQSGKGPRALLLDALQPVLARLLERAQGRLDPQSREDLNARLRLLFGTSDW